ncbi:NADH dehydrogenase (ubiquinone) subunit ND-13B [Brevipalpus obovatus]|uniref:NADH dehydrogenase (ubiquinone) subunit ND-13B n=1 Tax=Brevipalpus obovatus TaxID=246614 RepID=UPI003D9E226D
MRLYSMLFNNVTTKKVATLLGPVEVCPNPKEHLSTLYDRILKILVTMPEEAVYRKHTESIVQDRLKSLQNAPDILTFENKYQYQVEEMIYQARCEFITALKMAEFKAWEPLVAKPPEDQWKWPIN